MWTPKRILLLTAGFALFLAAYAVYVHFLGGIDGLPPLPIGYEPAPGPVSPPAYRPPPETGTDAKLRLAFGEDSEEVKRTIRLELQKGILLATQDIEIKDGLVELTPFSVAIFGKDRGDHSFPEINTIRGDKAILTFDRPIKNVLEMGNSKSKIVRGDLLGNIYVLNNRRTPERGDDISVFTQGPLRYEEKLHLIWTNQAVRVTDPQSKPQPTTIYGIGMTLKLATEAKPGSRGQAGKSSSQSVTGLEQIVLHQDVEMNLWVDAHSGFVGAGRPSQPAATRPGGRPAKEDDAAEKAKVVIVTQGPFSYDVHTDRATFDVSHNAGRRVNNNIVKVSRLSEKERKLDELICEHLDLQFRRKSGGPATDERAEGLDIESARATGKEVVLTSDAEILEAHGTDFFYDRTTHRSILKGNPMWAIKEGNQIDAPELQLYDVKGAQQATALGEGNIRMLDKTTGRWSHAAHWTKSFDYSKAGAQDLLTLKGTASFEDYERYQQLQAELLKVWLDPAEPAAHSTGPDPQQRKPRHVLAEGHVTAYSSELQVHDTERLEITFKDAPPGALPPAGPPAARPPDKPPPPTGGVAPPARGSGRPAAASARAGGQQTAPATARPTEPERPKKPIDLRAHTIHVTALRSDSRNDLDKLNCEGAVQVHQEPSDPDERGVDIRGETLELAHHVDGNELIVTGGGVTGDHAYVQINKLFILGPAVNIDQRTNYVWVNGLGAMRLPSKANLDGSPSSRESDLTINWEKRMRFDGQQAEFLGAVRAEQEDGHLACQEMQVTLDRRVSLREGDKSGPPAKVEKLVCDQEVWIQQVKCEGGRLISSKRIDCQQLTVDNDNESQDTIVQATGPGIVRMFQPGSEDPMQREAPDSKPKPGAKKPTPSGRPGQSAGKQEPDTELTYISFQGRMQANNKRGIATFYDKVVVVHVPTTDPDLEIKENLPPPEATCLNGEKLEVLNRKLDANRSSQEMRAYGNVIVEGQEFAGRADVVKYDESKDDQIIFEGHEGNAAVLYKQKGPGQDRDEIRGMKIIYWRKLGTSHVEGGQSIRGTN